MVRPEIRSLRPSRHDFSRLVVALWISLLVHLGAWGTYELGKKIGAWEKLAKLMPQPPPPKKKPGQLIPKQMDEPAMIFVEVSEPASEAPKNAKYYSTKNSKAANPDADKNSSQPKSTGKQKEIPKTEDVPALTKNQPTPAPAPSQQAAKAVPVSDQLQKLSSLMNIGNLKLNQVQVAKTETQNNPATERPRTLQQAQAQSKLPGQAMQQDGGVARRALKSSLDVKSSVFGEYDRAIVEAVTQRWYDLLDSRRFAQDRTGKVTVQFRLLPDGTITEVKFLENTVGQLLGYVCQESIQEAAPFAKWPADMRRLLNTNYREIAFTFYYY
jgi:hypothetical protein